MSKPPVQLVNAQVDVVPLGDEFELRIYDRHMRWGLEHCTSATATAAELVRLAELLMERAAGPPGSLALFTCDRCSRELDVEIISAARTFVVGAAVRCGVDYCEGWHRFKRWKEKG